MNHLIKLVFLTWLFLSGTANADILIEPYAGILKGSGEQAVQFNNGSGTLEMESDYLGLGYGARLGYGFAGLTIGLDVSKSSYEVEATAKTNTYTWNSNTIATEKYDVDDTYMGIFVSYELPILFKVWATYFVVAERELTNDSGGTGIFKQNDKLEGNGTAVGIAYTLMPLFNINLEFRTIEFDQNTGGVDTSSPTGRKYDSRDSQVMLSVSIPLEL